MGMRHNQAVLERIGAWFSRMDDPENHDKIKPPRKPKLPFWMTCKARPENQDNGCFNCHAFVRAQCRYATAMKAETVVIGGPDFRPKCEVYGMRCGMNDCAICTETPLRQGWRSGPLVRDALRKERAIIFGRSK